MNDPLPNSRDIPRAPLPPEASAERTTASRHTRAGRAARRRPWIAFGLSLITLFGASWIVVPAPNRTLLNLSVGAPEVSVWLVIMALVAIVGAIRTWRVHMIARVATVAGVVAILLACWPIVRFPAMAARTENSLRTTLGEDYLDAVPFERQLLLRPSPVLVAELFRGLPKDSVLVTPRIRFATAAKVPLNVIVYQPPAAGVYPTIVQIYGGAWQRGTPESFAHFARFFAARGYVVFAIDYRHAPEFHFAEQLADVKTALSWVRRNAVKYGADTSRIALLGRSAGAHLAMMAGYDAAETSVKAVVNFYGPVDLVQAYLQPPSPDPLNIRDVELKFIGAPLQSGIEKYQQASPINLVRAGLPPTLSMYGARDNIVERKYGALLHDRLTSAGNTSVFLDIPWADHGFDEVPNGWSGQLSLYATERFLAWALTRSR